MLKIFIIIDNYYYSIVNRNLVIEIVDLSNSIFINKKVILITVIIIAILLGLISLYILVSTGILQVGPTENNDGG